MSHSVIPFPQREQKRGYTPTTKVPGYARKLAASLMWTLQIQPGLALVYILGHGDEYSNQRAVETWIMEHYSSDDIAAMESPVQVLHDALSRMLSHYDTQEALSC